MSRYSLKPLPGRSDIFEVAVGWDQGLGTFFVMVFGVPNAGRDPDLWHWQGGQPNQITTVKELHDVVAPYAEIPLELTIRLATDQRDSNANPARRLSRFISQMLNR